MEGLVLLENEKCTRRHINRKLYLVQRNEEWILEKTNLTFLTPYNFRSSHFSIFREIYLHAGRPHNINIPTFRGAGNQQYISR